MLLMLLLLSSLAVADSGADGGADERWLQIQGEDNRDRATDQDGHW